MRPLKVTATLNGAIAGSVPMLDAILEWRMSLIMGERLGLHHSLGDERAPYQPGLIPIPLIRRRVEGFAHSIPLCSSPIFHAELDRHENYTRRFGVDPSIIAPDERKVLATTNGEFKSYRLPLRARSMNSVVWFCVGHNARSVKEIKSLLKAVTHLGKKTSQGFGRVAEWTVEDIEHDFSWYAPSESGPVLMRPMPKSAVREDAMGAKPWFGGIVPPYWCRDFFAEAVTPC